MCWLITLWVVSQSVWERRKVKRRCSCVIMSKHCKYLHLHCKPGLPSRHTQMSIQTRGVCVHRICILEVSWYVCSAKIGPYCMYIHRLHSQSRGHFAKKDLSHRIWETVGQRATSGEPHKISCLFCHTWGMLCMPPFSSSGVCMQVLKGV